MSIRQFIQTHYKHFNAKALAQAAQAYGEHLQQGNRMMITLAGAMSTAELGISLAEMIRQKKVHAICCTGANLEEDLFNLVAHQHYKEVPHWRSLSAEEDEVFLAQKLNRVTDTCIPEEEALRAIESKLLQFWQKADQEGQAFFPHEFMFQLLRSRKLDSSFQIDPKNSWLYAASQQNLPIFTPGWEDSTLGNMFVAAHLRGDIKSLETCKSGLQQMKSLVSWYRENTSTNSIGFFQIGGGIAGDFPICVVPLIKQDLQQEVKLWSYFCQISDSTASYGSYSGAFPNEKISWGKLNVSSPKFIIESDATIVAPLIFAYVLAHSG